MKVAIVQPYVVASPDPNSKSTDHYHSQSARFCQSYREFRPETPHEFVVIASGGKLPEKAETLYDGIKTRVVNYDGTGWAEGAYIAGAWTLCDFDLLVCLIPSIHFQKPGWLERLVAAREKYEPGLYGVFGSYELVPHIRSCAFAVSPDLLMSYPHAVASIHDAHRFEHGGDGSFTQHVEAQGILPLMVTWDGVYAKPSWREPENVWRKGDQSNCLMLDHHADNYMASSPEGQAMACKIADGK